jgi:iron complex outermembrane receptor protein
MAPAVLLTALLAMLAVPARAQEGGGAAPAGSTEVTVTGSLLGLGLRPASVLSGGDLGAVSAFDPISALLYVPSVDLTARSPFGGQADLNLLGATFEQALLLVDGFPVTDPQTGHHLLEFLPPAEVLERVEVLKGPASAAYGPGAFGGVVQVVTRRPSREAAASAGILRGAGLTRGSAVVSGGGFLGAASLLSDTGYSRGTEQNRADLFGRFCRGGLDLSAGYQDKRFGAWQAYSDLYPDEWEAVRGGYLRGAYARGPWEVDAGVRRKRDHFILDRAHPEWYEAFHTTEGVWGRATVRGRIPGGAGLFGVEGARDRIASDRLGNHARGRAGVFGEGAWNAGAWTVLGGLRVETLDGTVRGTPHLTAGRSLRGPWTVHVSAGRAYRLPSFTELYTQSPATLGHEGLRSESAWGVETGLERTSGASRLSLLAFYRRGRDLIDFVRPSRTSLPLQARNVASQEVAGIGAEASGPLGGGLGWSLATTLLTQEARIPPGFESRYVGTMLRHHEVAGLTYRGERLEAGLFVRAWQRENRTGHAEVDARIAYGWPAAGGRITVEVEGRNLNDRPERNFFGGAGPGRTVWAGMAVSR